jgi:hypothetical protein
MDVAPNRPGKKSQWTFHAALEEELKQLAEHQKLTPAPPPPQGQKRRRPSDFGGERQ